MTHEVGRKVLPTMVRGGERCGWGGGGVGGGGGGGLLGGGGGVGGVGPNGDVKELSLSNTTEASKSSLLHFLRIKIKLPFWENIFKPRPVHRKPPWCEGGPLACHHGGAQVHKGSYVYRLRSAGPKKEPRGKEGSRKEGRTGLILQAKDIRPDGSKD